MILVTVYIALSVLLFGMMIFTTIRSFAGIDIGMSTHIEVLSNTLSSARIFGSILFGIAVSILIKNNRLSY